MGGTESGPRTSAPDSIDATIALLESGKYLPSRELATAVFLALRLQRPLLLEGEPGTGKTEIARVLSQTLARRLIRLQCYEGLDLAAAAYEWNVARQLLEIRVKESAPTERVLLAQSLYDERFLIRRALLDAIDFDDAAPPVLLIDELDRADEPFEAFLLEFLADFAITIPELGRRVAKAPPIVILTSNRTREIHDAVRRRCLYHWVEFPDFARELAIVKTHLPGLTERLAREVVVFVQRLRSEDLFKQPGIAETIEWSRALAELDTISLDPHIVRDTLGVLLKYQDDIAKLAGGEIARILEEARERAEAMPYGQSR